MIRTAFWVAVATAFALGTAGAAAASDPAPAKPKRQCFLADNVTNFSAIDSRTVNLRVGVKDVYQLDLLGTCPDIDWNHEIALVSRGSSWICSGLDATVITKGPIGPQRCAVRAVRKLTPQEIAALPSRAKP